MSAATIDRMLGDVKVAAAGGRRRRVCFFFFQAEDGIRDLTVTGVQTCALPISLAVAAVTWLVFQGAWRLAALAGQGLAGRAGDSPDEPIPQPRRLSPGDGRPRNGSQWRR